MERRDLIKSGLAAAVGTLAARSGLAASHEAPGRQAFKLRYAPHFGMFEGSAGEDPLDQLRFMAEHGFSALEDNEMRERPVSELERIAREMGRLGMAMGVFVAHTIYWREPNLASGREDWREEFLADIRGSVEVAKRTNATWMTVVPGHVDLRRDFGYQTANVIESLKRAAGILEPHGLVMVLEPLNFFNHPGLFLEKIPQAYEICRAVDSPACKILNLPAHSRERVHGHPRHGAREFAARSGGGARGDRGVPRGRRLLRD
jgi:hydroxypyruvate isomerase